MPKITTKTLARRLCKRSEVMPIKMTLKHRPAGRTIIFHRQCLWNVMGTERNDKYKLICNWLEFTDESLDELFQDLFRQKMSRKQCCIISTQRLMRNITKQLMIYQCGKCDVFNPAQTTYAYALCHKRKCTVTILESDRVSMSDVPVL